MRRIFPLFFLLASLSSYCQYYGADGGVAAFGRIGVHLWEKPKYVEIEKWQDYIRNANAIVAAEMVKLNDLEKKTYKGLSELDENIKSTRLVLLITFEADEIYELISDIIELGDDNIKVQAYTLDLEAYLLLEVGFILKDYLIAQKEGKKNLMNSSDRYLLLDMFYKRIVELKKRAQGIYNETNAISLMSNIDFSGENPVIIDFAPLHKKMAEAYKKIFPNTLKD